MSEELLQRDLIDNPEKIGNWNFYNIGATTIKNLRQSRIINDFDYDSIDKRKPDGLIVYNKNVLVTIENKKPSEFNTDEKKQKAIKQAVEVAKVLKSKLAVITDTTETIWVNAFTGDKIIDENGKELNIIFSPKDPELPKLIEKILDSIDETNSQLNVPSLKNPTPLAKQIWQDIWTVSGATPENCLYTFVEIFIFKYLSDLEILKGNCNFYSLIDMYKNNTDNDVLEYYAKIVRPRIKELFPKNLKDNTTIINGTIFVSKDDKAIEGYSGVFKKILNRFLDYGRLEKIDYDFKSKLFESFLKESISKKNWGQFFTPLKVVKPMVKMADIHTDMKICDPACGVGKFLLEAVLPHLKNYYPVSNGKLNEKITLHGFDKGFDKEEQRTIILAKANMLIYFSDIIKDHSEITTQFAKVFNETFELKTNSILGTLRDPIRDEYDLILTNPPYVTSGSSNLKDEIKKDFELESYYKVNALGVEGLFMEWIINALKPGGKAFVVIPDGILNRKNDTDLRKFILKTCYLDALISLPINTFFTTNKKTYIIALTKKFNTNEEQNFPVFSYLVSDIGETLDMYRFDTGENQLEEAVELFNVYRSSKFRFNTNDKRCKLFPIEKFELSVEDNWIIDKWWTDDEKIELGILDKSTTITPAEFSEYIGDISNDLLEYKVLFESLAEKKKNNIEFKQYKLCDLFDFDKGKSKYTKKYGNENKGEYPVYSASNIAPLTYINTCDYDGRYLTWATNGFAGYMKVIDGRFSINGDRGIMIPKRNDINIDYIRYILQPELRKLAKGRKGEKGEDEFTKLYISMIDKLDILMPVIQNTDKFSSEYQIDYVEKKSAEDEFSDYISKKQIEIKEFNIEEISFEKSIKLKICDLFEIKKGKSIYTNKYFHENKGKYPVYSSQTFQDGEIAKINSYDFDSKCLTWTTDGIYAGTLFLRNGKFSMTTHCGALILKEKYREDISLEYVYAYLYNRIKKYAKGVQNKRVTVDIIKNIEVEVPINNDNGFDKEQQFYFSQMFEQFQQSKQDIVNKLQITLSKIIDWN